jgi:hypothetical protein
MGKFLYLVTLIIFSCSKIFAQNITENDLNQCTCSVLFKSDTIKQYEETQLKKKSITGYYQLYNKYNQVTWCGYIRNSQLYSGLKFIFDTASGFNITVLNNIGDEVHFEGKSKGNCWYNGWGAVYHRFEKYDKNDSLIFVSGNMTKDANCYDLDTYKINYKDQLYRREHSSSCRVDTSMPRFYTNTYAYNARGLLSDFIHYPTGYLRLQDTNNCIHIYYKYDSKNRLIKKTEATRNQYPHPLTTQAIYIYKYFEDGMREEILVKKEDGSVK